MGRNRGRHLLLRRVLASATFALGAWGCAIVAGVDFGSARLEERADGEACPPDQKACDGVCVSKSDPAYGCGAASCSPCSLAHVSGTACSADGACVPAGCETGFDDCDHDPTNGCESDLRRKETCGSCTNACAGGLLCAPSGCVADCPAPLTECAGSCLTALPIWYVDEDGDGYGTDASITACERPDGHAPSSGDCLDSNPAVFPDAAAAATPFAGPNGLSFDYDCDGTEVEQGTPVHFVTCGVGCNGEGYLPRTPSRSGAGVNNYCGSALQRVCFDDPIDPGCNSFTFDSGAFIKCR